LPSIPAPYGPRVPCPARDYRHPPLAPSSPGRGANGTFPAQLRRIRAAAVRAYWMRARRLSLSLTRADYQGWFIAALDTDTIPDDGLKRILWLIEVRDSYLYARDSAARCRIDGAIWQECQRLRAAKLLKNRQFSRTGKKNKKIFPKTGC